MYGLPEHVKKYLQKYSLLKYWNVETQPQEKFKFAIVIPALNEFQNIVKLLDSLSKNKVEKPEDFLVLFVINNIKDANEEIVSGNRQTLNYLQEVKKSSPFQIEIIDAFSGKRALPQKTGGVGLARKIGLDAALQVLDYSFRSGLVCLDADCVVSENYLRTVAEEFSSQNFHAGYFKFEHRLDEDEEVKNAIICYEIFLRYYVLGLKFARSPYAFHTIGSTMFFDVETYINVGGMNKRKAGEDFYFLEKVAKNFEVKEIAGAKVFPSARASLRVPFGTGQRVHRFLNRTQDEYLVYSPESFLVLKKWNDIFINVGKESAENYLKLARKINPVLEKFLIENDFPRKWEGILKHSASDEQILRQKKFWFDGFRTLKLIHYLRDTIFPNVNMFEGVNGLLKLVGENEISITAKIPPLKTQIKILKKLRELA